MQNLFRPRCVVLCTRLLVGCLVLAACHGDVIAQQDWWERSAEARTKYYNAKTDLPKEQAIELANHLDRTFESYAALFKGLKLRRIARLDVYIFAEQSDYLDILRRRFNTEGTRSGGMCITRGDVISLVAWKGDHSMDALKSTLQHEGFHQFASNFFPKLPTWANEGLAEVFGRGVLVDGTIVLGEVSRTDIIRLQAAKRDNSFKAIGNILTVKQADWNHQLASGNVGANYLQAWCLVHCFLYAEDSKYQKQFIGFLKLINEGSPWEKAFVIAFGVPDFSSMNETWLRYVDSLNPMDYRETTRRMEFLANGYMKLREQEIYPLSFEELQTELNKINFNFESTLFGKKSDLNSADSNVFTIPQHDFWNEEPVFELVDSKGKKPDPEKYSKLRKPKPLVIQTKGLVPTNFKVTWKHSSKSPGGYQPVFGVN